MATITIFLCPSNPSLRLSGPERGQAPNPRVAVDWTRDDDRTLVVLRAMGKGWEEIQKEEFPARSASECQERHRHLMEGQDLADLDKQRLNCVSDKYISRRDEKLGHTARRINGDTPTSGEKVKTPLNVLGV